MSAEHYIYAGFLVAILVLFTVLIIVYRKYIFYSQKSQKHIDKLNKKHEIKSTKLNGEIKRLQYLIDRNALNEPKVITLNKTDIREQGVDRIDITKQNIEKEKLEHEKLEFKKKNKQLWEQSIAIHKEKERIDALKKEIEARHRDITDSIKYASRIQTALLPDNETLNDILPEYFILWKPRDIVSGDFYWIRQINEKTIIVAADCTGHGVPGAFMSMLGISFLNEISTQFTELTPALLLEEMRIRVKKSLQQTGKTFEAKDGMDMAVCILNNETNILEYAGANNPLYIIRQGSLIETKATRNPVGIYPKERLFKNHTFTTQKGDFIYIFSDGFQDQIGGDKKSKFKVGKFKTLLTEISTPSNSMSEIKQILEDSFDEWKGDYDQIDDILIFGMNK